MAARAKLTRLLGVILEEAARNQEFAARLDEVLEGAAANRGTRKPTRSPEGARRGGRRTPALVDPVAVAHQGEAALRDALATLDLERLLDVVAEHGMDPGKLVMKWKDRERVIDRIVDIALARSTKGDAFRSG
jgi:hypothetical protein